MKTPNPAFDESRALAFVGASRSRLVSLAADWLTSFDDPVDLLFALSGDAGQAMGPFECFRMCALLGLHHANAVHELALDVLAEPVTKGYDGPPVDHAFALAHAKRLFPAENALHEPALVAALAGDRERGHAVVVECAQYLFTNDDDERRERRQKITRGLPGDGAAAAFALEAAFVRDDRELFDRAMTTLASSQKDDGSVPALREHAVLRGYATLRVCGILKARRAGPQTE